jgi:hypothetical protein
VTIGTAAAAAGDGQVWLVRFAQKRRTQSVPVRMRAARSTIQTVSKAWRRSARARQRGDIPARSARSRRGLAVLVQAADGHILGAAILLGS